MKLGFKVISCQLVIDGEDLKVNAGLKKIELLEFFEENSRVEVNQIISSNSVNENILRADVSVKNSTGQQPGTQKSRGTKPVAELRVDSELEEMSLTIERLVLRRLLTGVSEFMPVLTASLKEIAAKQKEFDQAPKRTDGNKDKIPVDLPWDLKEPGMPPPSRSSFFKSPKPSRALKDDRHSPPWAFFEIFRQEKSNIVSFIRLSGRGDGYLGQRCSFNGGMHQIWRREVK